MDQEEIHASAAGEASAHLHDDLLLAASLALLTRDLDSAALSSGACLVFERARKCLIPARDDLVDGELDRASEVVAGQVVDVFLVVDVVDLDFEVLALLEMILHIEALHPLWAQVIHNDFGHSQLLPLVADLFVKDDHTVSARESVQVGQILACEA